MSEAAPFLFTPPMSTEDIRKQTRISDDFYTVYSNHVRVTFSQIDFRVFVGEVYVTATGKTEIVENLCVAMPPQLAKAVLGLLQGSVAAHEKNFGVVPPPKIISEQIPPAQPAEPKLES
jgi:hypothetical protein